MWEYMCGMFKMLRRGVLCSFTLRSVPRSVVVLAFTLFLLNGVLIPTRVQASFFSFAQHESTTGRDSVGEVGVEETSSTKKFDPSKLIFDHILDSHEWHILAVGDVHLTIPLPVILYSRHRGEWHCFLSNRFHEGHASYAGFRMELPPGGGKARIVEDLPADQVSKQPIDLSITKNVLGIFFVCGLMVWLFVSMANRYRTGQGVDSAPKGKQSLLEPVVLFIRDEVAIPSIGQAKADRFMPLLLTLFFFILLNNLLGLVPIFPAGANITGNITVTMVLALFTFFATNFSGSRHYWKHVFNTPGIPTLLKIPVPIIPLVEIFGVLNKPIVLMIRLFANMLSGHMIVLVFMSLIFLFGAINALAGYAISVVSVSLSIFMLLLDVLVSFIQAYVFTLLSAVYFGAAVGGDDH